jgi:hypothetical protein
MDFGLLVPAALGLGVLVAGPLLAHLSRRPPREDLPFGLMPVLRRVVRRVRRRRRLDDLLLLLLRALLVLLAVFAASRPELRWPTPPDPEGPQGPVVVLLDTSFSMDLRTGPSSTRFSEARAAAAALLRALPEGTPSGAVTFGGTAARVVPALQGDPGAVAVQVEAALRSDGPTDLAGGLREARRMLDGKGGTLYLFTDEAGPVAVPAAEEEIRLLGAQGAALIPKVIPAPVIGNLAIVEARYGEGVEGGSVRVVVRSYGETPVEVPLAVTLPDGPVIRAFVEVPPDGTGEERVTVPRVTDGGVGVAQIDDPLLPADNLLAFHLPRVGASRVLVVDGDPGPTPTASEVYFLERALAPWGGGGRVGVLPEVVAPSSLEALDPERHRVVFLANLPDLAPHAARLTDFVQRGGGLVLSLGENTTAEATNAALGALLPAPLREVRSLDGAPTALPDAAHPLFAPFSRGGRAGFARVRWARLFTTDPPAPGDGAEVLLRTEGGIPVLLSRAVGRGRVVLLTSTMDLGWSDFPLQAVYMPFVQRLVGWLGADAGGNALRLDGVVGAPVGVPVPDGVDELVVRGDDGPVPAAIRGGELRFTPSRAGAYRVEVPGAPPLAWAAVRLDAAESDVRAGPPLLETAARVDPERYLRRVRFAPWLLGAAALLFLVSLALAGPRTDAGKDGQHAA